MKMHIGLRVDPSLPKTRAISRASEGTQRQGCERKIIVTQRPHGNAEFQKHLFEQASCVSMAKEFSSAQSLNQNHVQGGDIHRMKFIFVC